MSASVGAAIFVLQAAVRAKSGFDFFDLLICTGKSISQIFDTSSPAAFKRFTILIILLTTVLKD
jgi:hypothetical protein